MKLQRRFILLLQLVLPTALTASEVSYFYDDAGRLVQVAYPQGSGIRYTYDNADNLTQLQTVSLPRAPEGLQAVFQSATTAGLQWNPVGGASGYRIYRRSTGDRVWSELTSVSAGTSSFFDTTLAPGTDYVYQVFALSPGGFSSAGSVPASPRAGFGEEIEALVDLPPGSQNLLRLAFSSEEGTLYRLEATGTFQVGSWTPEAFSLAPAGTASTQPVIGTGGWVTLFVPYTFGSPNRFFRVVEAE